MKGSAGVVRWLVAAYDTGVSGHCRQLQRIFALYTADSHVSNAVAKRKVNTFTPCSQTRGKLHDSGTHEHPTNRTPVSPIFSVHKMVADAPPDVTSPTFLTYFSLRASGLLLQFATVLLVLLMHTNTLDRSHDFESGTK